MLVNTFRHLPQVGPVAERRFWESGVHSWQDFAAADLLRISDKRRVLWTDELELSRERLDARDAAWFAERLPLSEHWRLYEEFRDELLFFDIETTGTSPDFGAHITTIVTYDGRRLREYIYGENLRDFIDDIRSYRALVSFNGRCFDAPWIESHFLTELPHAHIDLRFVLRGLKLRGGLKSIEKQLEIDRDELDGVDGYAAVLLWRRYEQSGDRRWLEALLAYNRADVINLELLLHEACRRASRLTPFEYVPPRPLLTNEPYVPDADIAEFLEAYAAMRSGGYGY